MGKVIITVLIDYVNISLQKSKFSHWKHPFLQAVRFGNVSKIRKRTVGFFSIEIQVIDKNIHVSQSEYYKMSRRNRESPLELANVHYYQVIDTCYKSIF
jgi:hypothetical protein